MMYIIIDVKRAVTGLARDLGDAWLDFRKENLTVDTPRGPALARQCYKAHRRVDAASAVITAFSLPDGLTDKA